MGDEELVIVGPADVLEQQRQDIGSELDRLVTSEQCGDGCVVKELRQAHEGRLQPVVQLRAIRHTATRADVDHWFAAARLIAERAVLPNFPLDEAAATPLGEDGDEVGERLPEPAGDHVDAGFDVRVIELGGVPGRMEHEDVAIGELGDR